MTRKSQRLACPPTSGSRIWHVFRYPTLSFSLASPFTISQVWTWRLYCYHAVARSHSHHAGDLALHLAGYQHPCRPCSSSLFSPSGSPSAPPHPLHPELSPPPPCDCTCTCIARLHVGSTALPRPPNCRLPRRWTLLRRAWIMRQLWFPTRFCMQPPHRTSASSPSKGSCAPPPKSGWTMTLLIEASHHRSAMSPTSGVAMAAQDATLHCCF
jgi:hypothetical protein